MTWEEEMRDREKEAAAQARAEAALETARRLLGMNLAPEKIAEATALPLERVERLRQEAAAEA